MDDLLMGSNRATRHHSPARSTISSNSNSKKYYETDLDLTIKVPKKSSSCVIEDTKRDTAVTSNGQQQQPTSRVINISVTKSESLNFVSQLNGMDKTTTNGPQQQNKENAVDDIKISERPSNFSREF